MTAELGAFFLVLALLLALLQASALAPLPFPMRLYVSRAALLQALCVALALAVLVTLRLDSDFSVENVVMNSNLSLPTLYKVAGAWGNHEGSMLLFCLVLSVFGAALAMQPAQGKAVAVQAAVAAGALAFTLFTSNPFVRVFPPTTDGQALNPLLQDIALAMHPPLLYLGYVGFSVVFSLAAAALIEGKCGRDWAQNAHPWILAAWSALTFGIGLGSWWAYRELGWGGWWFWDPVENASLLPWLSGTALLHANLVLKKRGLLCHWVLILSIVTFALSLIGTFLVRSGALTSVHSFASDPERGLFILAYFTLTVGGAFLLYALRAANIKTASETMLPTSREGMIVINNLFVLTACATVLLGTLYPLFSEWLGSGKLTVGAPYFNATFLPMMAVPLLFAGLAPLMPWKKASLKEALVKSRHATMAAAMMMLVVLSVAHSGIVLGAAGFGLSAWLLTASLQWLAKGRGRAGMLPVFLGHLGVAVIVAGITSVSLWKTQAERMAAPGDTLWLGGYRLLYEGDEAASTDNYVGVRSLISIQGNVGEIARLVPEYRKYAIREIATSETSIYSTWGADIYAASGDTSPDGKRRSLRLYYVPMIRFIWLGFALIGAGGLAAWLERKRHA